MLFVYLLAFIVLYNFWGFILVFFFERERESTDTPSEVKFTDNAKSLIRVTTTMVRYQHVHRIMTIILLFWLLN